MTANPSEETEQQSTETTAPPSKRQRTSSLFASYDRRHWQATADACPSRPSVPLRTCVMNYIDTVGSLVHSMHTDRWVGIRQQKQFESLYPFLESVFAIPATSAPVEHVFSHSGIFMQPHRARLSDKVLSDMVYVKCNSHLSGL